MELPEDVLKIVRDYSRPFTRYRKEYEAAMQVFNMTDWKDLRKKLHGDADELCAAMVAFKNAYIETNLSISAEYEILHVRTFSSNEEKWSQHDMQMANTDKVTKFKFRKHKEMLRLMYGRTYE